MFHETYHAYDPVLRALLEGPAHARISADNLAIYEHVTTTVERGELTDARPGGLIRGPRKVRRDKSMR